MTIMCVRRSRSFTSVFNRRESPAGRTVLERALTSVLDALGDDIGEGLLQAVDLQVFAHVRKGGHERPTRKASED